MPVRKNPAYSDPYMAQAAGNIAKLFDTSNVGAQSLAFQKAAAEKADTERLAQLYEYAKQPGFVRENFDRAAVAAGRYTPSNSYYNVDTDAATARRGQDVTAGAQRYGYDVTARTSEANNVRDNTRQIDEANIKGRYGLLAQRYGSPLNEGQVMPAMPGDVAAVAGLPAMAQSEGREKPLSLDEVRSIAFRQLPSFIQQQSVLTGPGVVPVLRDGKTVLESNAGAIGQEQPADPVKLQKPENYQRPDGSTGMFILGPDGTPIDTDSKLPIGNAIKSSAVVQGTPGDFKKTTEAENKMAYAAAMSEPAVVQIVNAFDKGELPSQADYQIYNAMMASPTALRPALVQNISPQGQRFYQSIRTALPYQLMAQSGQAVTEQEYDRKLMELVPIPGEDPSVSLAKRGQFENYVKISRGLASTAYDKAKSTPRGAPPPAPVERWERGPDGKMRKAP